MKQGLQAGGVDITGIVTDGKLKTGATIILANPPKKALLTYMGAMTEMKMKDINWEYVKQARHLHMGCFYLQTGLVPDVVKIFTQAKSLGLTTSLDTNWDPSEKWSEDLYEILKHTDVFLPNDDEAIRIAHESTLDQAIEKLRKMVRVLAIKKGKEGTVVCSGSERFEIPSFRVEAVETTGAGDSFNAGFLHQFIHGKDLRECAVFGNACGALAVTALGGTGAFQDKAVVQKKLKEILEG
jgi:sugar/nucleoside kinase (ribokinase family)